jgi:hypothetical protein
MSFDIQLRLQRRGIRYDLPFLQAVQTVQDHCLADRKAWERLTKKIQRDQKIIAFLVELNNEKYPPTWDEWALPLAELDSASSAYRGGNMQAAKRHFEEAIANYRHVRRKWVAYRFGNEVAANERLNHLEWSLLACTVVATAGAGSMIAAAGAAPMLAGTASSALVAGGTSALKSVGLVAAGVEKEFDWGKMTEEMAHAVVTSLVGGALSKSFLHLLGPRLSMLYGMGEREIALAMKSLRQGSSNQKLVTETAVGALMGSISEAVKSASQKARGKSISTEDFLLLVADEYSRDLARNETNKAYLGELIKKVVK